MGRPKKKEDDLKVKFGISLNPKLFNLLSKEFGGKSKFIEKLIKDYYEKKII